MCPLTLQAPNISTFFGDNDLDCCPNMDEPDYYNPLEFSMGAESSPPIDPTMTFGEADEFLPSAAPAQNNLHVQITEPFLCPRS
jgi:hypothetical protein